MKRNTSKPLSLAQLEDLFVEKLQEKYQLTTRDLQRAFKRFDLDGSGHLSVIELTKAIQHYLNGVDPAQVQALVSRYDVDNDGEISLDEFCQFLLSRNAVDREDWLTVDHLTSTSNRSHSQQASTSRAHGEFTASTRHEQQDSLVWSSDVDDGTSVEYCAKLFLHNMKMYILRKTHELRSEGKISFRERCGQHFGELSEGKARAMLEKSFLPYTQGKQSPTVDFPTFSRVIQKFVYPGSAPPKEPLLRYLFGACLASGQGQRADPDVLVDLMFSKERFQVNQFGFSEQARAPTDTGRPTNGVGPFSTSAAAPPVQISEVPFRFVTRHCRTALATPSNFNTHMIRRSAAPPSFSCQRDHIFGLNTSLYSGSMIHGMTSPEDGDLGAVVVYSAAAVGVIHNIADSAQNFFDGHTDDITCISVSADKSLAATGQAGRSPEVLVWSTADPASGAIARIGKGFFSRGVCAVEFSFDATFLVAVSCDDHHSLGVWHISSGQLMASSPGSNGVPPQIKSVKFSPCLQLTGFISGEHSGDCDVIVTAGERNLKFWSFQRPVSSSLRGSSLESKKFRLGKLTVEAAKVFTCVEFTSPRNTVSRSTDSTSNGGRPGSSGRPSSTTLGVDTSIGLCDVVTGGDNGFLYLWRQGLCVKAVRVIPNEGSLDCLQIHRAAYGEDLIFCGGSGGNVVIVNAYTFDVLSSYCILSNARPSASSEPTSMFTSGPFAQPTAAARTGARGATAAGAAAGVQARARPASAGRMRPKLSAGSNPSGAGDVISAGAASTALGRSIFTGMVKKATAVPPKDAWVRPGKAEERALELALEGTKGSSSVISLALVYGRSRDGWGGSSSRLSVTSLVILTGFGKAFTLDVTSRSGQEGLDTLFYYHYGALWALAALDKPQPTLNVFLTGGDDRWLSMWSSQSNSLMGRIKTEGPIRAIDITTFFTGSAGLSKLGNSLESSVAVGLARGQVAIYLLSGRKKKSAAHSGANLVRHDGGKLEFQMQFVLSRKDCTEDISEVKFSPNGKMLAVGSHDNFIDIYHHKVGHSTNERGATIELKYLKRLRGHTSYITHLDWSADNKLIKSTCGSYELLYWDVSSGKQMLSSLDTLEADAVWHTDTCVLGFQVMGIWPPDSDGTDVNSVDVCQAAGVVATGDDTGLLNLFNYPCVAKNAPAISLTGHSSHIMNVKFLNPIESRAASDQTLLVTVGGNDCAAMSWIMTPK